MMTGSETLFNPQGGSLAEKVKAFSVVCRDFARAQASLKLVRKEKNVDYIGDQAQVESANAVISKSLAEASKNISENDIQEANTQRLISKSEFAEIVKYQRQKGLKKAAYKILPKAYLV